VRTPVTPANQFLHRLYSIRRLSYCPFYLHAVCRAPPDYARNSFQLLAGAGEILCGLVVFFDGINELPMTLIVGPSNCEKQTTYGLEFVTEELFEVAQLEALTIVVAGIIRVTIRSLVICSSQTRKRWGGIDPGATFVHQPGYDTIRPNLRDAEVRQFGWHGREGYGSSEFQA